MYDVQDKVDKKHGKSSESSELQKKLMNIAVRDDMVSDETDAVLKVGLIFTSYNFHTGDWCHLCNASVDFV